MINLSGHSIDYNEHDSEMSAYTFLSINNILSGNVDKDNIYPITPKIDLNTKFNEFHISLGDLLFYVNKTGFLIYNLQNVRSIAFKDDKIYNNLIDQISERFLTMLVANKKRFKEDMLNVFVTQREINLHLVVK